MQSTIKITPQLSLLIGGSIMLWGIAVFQSAVHSTIHNYHFYISEAVVFNLVWFLFAPVFYFQKLIYHRLQSSMSQWLRMASSIAVAILLHWMAFASLVWVLSSMFLSYTFTVDRMLLDSISDYGSIYILFYTLLGFLMDFTDQKDKRKSGFDNSRLRVSTGRTTTFIEQREIFYISAEKPYAAIHTNTKTYLHSSTLKDILQKLDPSFIRIHKSTIVNIQAVVSYKSRQNGDYDLCLSNGTEVRLSRNYAAAFKGTFLSHSLT